MSVVVLNRDFAFWDEVSVRKAIKWMVKDKIKVLYADETETFDGLDVSFPVPRVVFLPGWRTFKVKYETVGYSDAAVYARDDNCCQYWHYEESLDGSPPKRFIYRCTEEDRTIDHVIPKGRGGDTSFENCVCSCENCNQRIKKCRLPKEVG